VQGKVGDPAWIPADDRCEQCEAAIDYEGSHAKSWIGVSRGESEWPNGFVDFGPVTEDVCLFLNRTLVGQKKLLTHPLHVFYVCGLDHFNQCSYVETMPQMTNIHCAVVYRMQQNEQKIDRAVEKSGVIYIPLSAERSKLADVGSAAKAQHLETPCHSSHTNVEPHMYPHVLQYMKAKHGRK
jgi:hypothetical protein